MTDEERTEMIRALAREEIARMCPPERVQYDAAVGELLTAILGSDDDGGESEMDLDDIAELAEAVDQWRVKFRMKLGLG